MIRCYRVVNSKSLFLLASRGQHITDELENDDDNIGLEFPRNRIDRNTHQLALFQVPVYLYIILLVPSVKDFSLIYGFA